ncbi:MAG TPA: hypothetical protein PKD53_30010, partial [Chloroflexaceae bacterium]|nr:hypothetical protein [Chloroflexaceae bacterium]
EPASSTPGQPTDTPEPPTATAERPPTAPPPPPASATPTELAPPSATPTGTPSATATPTETATPTATPSPTPETPTAVAGCDPGLLAGGFGQLYDATSRVRAGLGCPLRRESAGDASQQFFAQGTMFYWDNGNRDERADYIFVFFGRDGGTFVELSNPEVSDLGPEPPPGSDPSQPVRGFGTVYFNLPGAGERLGPWTSPEIVLRGNQRGVIQYFEQGLMLWTPSYQPTGRPSIFVLYNDGTFERYDDA